MKQVLKALHQRPIAVYPIYIDLTGSIAGGLLLSQLLYWLEKVDREIWKTDAEIMSETRLTQTEFKNAKKAIAALPFISVTKRGIPPKTFYAVDWDELGVAIESLISSVTYKIDRRLSTSNRGGNLPNVSSVTDGVIHRLHSKNTTENTTVVENEFSTVILIDEVDETSVEIHHVTEYFETETKKERKSSAKKKESDDPTPIRAMFDLYADKYAELNNGVKPEFMVKYTTAMKNLFGILRARSITTGLVPLDNLEPWRDFLTAWTDYLAKNEKEKWHRDNFNPLTFFSQFNSIIAKLNNRPKTDAEKWIEWGKRQGL